MNPSYPITNTTNITNTISNRVQLGRLFWRGYSDFLILRLQLKITAVADFIEIQNVDFDNNTTPKPKDHSVKYLNGLEKQSLIK